MMPSAMASQVLVATGPWREGSTVTAASPNPATMRVTSACPTGVASWVRIAGKAMVKSGARPKRNPSVLTREKPPIRWCTGQSAMAAIAARAKVRFWGIAEVLQKKADDINLQAFLVCGEVPSEVDRLMRTSAENYYQVLSTFVHLSDLRTPREEQPEADDHG